MTLIPRYCVHRSVRFVLAFIATILLVAGRGSGRSDVLALGNPIPAENLLPGDPDWDVPGQGAGSASIQGFASDMSVNLGETIQFKIDTNSTDYRIDIYRLGYYNGAGARKVGTINDADITKIEQPACASDSNTGLIDCGNWETNASWAVPADAVSGVYLAKPTRQDGAAAGQASHIIFIVRDDSRIADIVFQTSDTTWQAYNLYGGNSLYCGAPFSNAGTAYGCPGRAVKVSYNRPLDTRDHDPQSFLFNAEYPMIRFLEANGYNVKYWSGVDTDRFGANAVMGLTSATKPKIFLSTGHDEYWSGTQRTNVENARNAGVSLSFMSGNEVYWKTRWEPAITGAMAGHRTLVSYKETLAGQKIDPSAEWTGTWRDPRFSLPLGTSDGGRPENALIGSIWTVNCCGSSIQVPSSMSGLRFWRNTRVADLLPGETATLASGSLGYEWGEALENGFQPDGLVRMSSTTLNDQEKIIDFGSHVGRGTATHTLTLYRHNSGAMVFGASTVQWAWGLDADHDVNSGSPTPNGPDQAIQQATINLFADMGVQPSTLQEGADPARPLVTSAQSSDIVAPTSVVTSPAPNSSVESGTRTTISGTAVDNGGGTVGGVEVSVDGGATWKKATGTASWTLEWTPGIVGTATIKTRATDDSGNVEAVGSGVSVSIIVGECPCTSLWNSSAVPANASAADSGEYELGVKFKSDVDGFITGIRFYKGPANNGTHVGNLWTTSGTLLASAVFTNETATGWQHVEFGSAVAITANTIYVASYHAPNGGYAFDPGYFTSDGKDSPPLHGLPSGVSGGNGVFSPGAMAFPTNTFNGNNYWVDVVFAQSLEDVTAPVISAVTATTIDSSRVAVQWTTDEASHTRIDYGTDPAIQTASLATLPPGTITAVLPAFVTQHSIALSGLQPNTTYYYLVSSTDPAGNTTTVAPPSFTVPGPTLRDTTASDFAAGTRTSTYVSQTADGEVILQPTVASEFTGPGLSEGWISINWNTQGSAAIIDGVLLVDGARVSSCANPAACTAEALDSTPSENLFAGPRSLEFSANYSGDQFQHAGLGQLFASTSEPWAIFSTLSGGMLFARSNTGNGAIDTPIGTAPLGEFHRYRIDWTPTSVTYYVDGMLVATHNVAVAGPMRPVAASDFNPFGGIIFVDWMRLLPGASPGTFESRVFDANALVDWKSIQWQADVPAGASLQISVRTGNTAVPDGSWSSWAPVAGPGAMSLNSQFIQYRADMSSSDPVVTPVLEDIIISTGSAPIAMPDSAAVAKNGSRTFQASGPGSLTFNDTDPDVNDTLRVVGVSAPSHGTVVLNADGSVTYTPASLYEGPDAFIYTVTDGLLAASTTVSLDVRFGNVPPVAVNNFYGAVEDTTLTVRVEVGLLANDSDAERDVLQAELLTLPAHGQLAFGANGSFSYTPAENYAGPDSFSYRAFDGTDNSNTAIVHLEIAQVNDAPFTEPDAFTALLDRPLDVPAPGVLANDHDVEVEDTAPLRAQLVSNVSHGQLILRADGSFSYVPDLSFLGTDSFTYKAVDHFDAVSAVEKTVTLTVALKTVAETVGADATVSTGSGVNADNPLSSSVMTPVPATVRIAQGVISGSESPASYTFLNQQVNITVTDATGAEVTASLTNPLVLTFQIDKSLVPAGQDHTTFEFFRNNVLVPDCLNATTIPDASFDPCVSGRSDNGDRITLTILTSHASTWNMGLEAASLGGELIATSDGPFATNFQVPIERTAPGVLGDDFGPSTLSAQLSGTPQGGTVMLAPSGAYTFTPDAGHCGPASFKYKAREGVAESNEATVSLVVNCVPDAVSDTVSVVEDNVTTITVLSNDTDPEGQPLSITTVTQAAHGTVAIVAGGMAVSYTPAANFFGSDSFTYTIQDPSGDTDTATISLTVTPVNDAPSFVLDSDQAIAEDAGPQTVSGLATAISAGPVNESSQALSFLIGNTNNALFSAQPAVDADGVLTYTPAANAYGSATITLRLHDDGGVANGGVDTSGPRTFVITVTPVNDNPVANADSATVAQNSGVTNIAVRTNDNIGPDTGETLTVTAVTTAGHGTAAVTATGVSYAPAANYVGPDSFTYTINDGNGGSATATVTVTVTPMTPSTTSKPTTSQTPAAYGTNLTFTTTVTGAGGPPTGVVEFFDGIVSLGTAPLNAAGTAAKTTNAVAAGTRAITAKYLGDSRFAASTSLPLTQTVTGVAAPVTTTFTASPLTPQYSDRMTFTASVSPATVNGKPAAKVALFKVGAQVVGTAPLTLNMATGKLEATLNAPLLETTAGVLRPGIKTAAVEFVEVSPGYTIANKTASTTVKAEDALTTYTGPAEVVTTTGATTIRLEAKVEEVADGNLGDIRTATVAFVNRTTGATIGAAVLDATKSTPTTAYYYYNYAVNIGANASQTFTIGTFVNGYYTRNATADNGTTIVKKP